LGIGFCTFSRFYALFKMNKKKCSLLLLCLQGVLGLYAQQKDSIPTQKLEEVTVSESRFPLKRSQTGKIVTKITADDLQKTSGKNLAEVLNSVVGIEINGSNSHPGQNLGYSIRGSRNRQVLILIDGVQVTDPSAISSDFDLRLLNVDEVASIEILKGASSVLYGTGAAAATINITLKEPEINGFSGKATWAAGTNQSQDDHNYRINDLYNAYSLSGKTGKISFLGSLSYQDLEGLSAIKTAENKADDFSRINALAKIGVQINPDWKTSVFGNFDRFKSDFDESFGLTDADNQSFSANYRAGISSTYQIGKHTLNLNGAYQVVDRDIQSSFPSRFNAESWVGDLFGKFVIGHSIYTIIGVNAQHNSMESASIPFGETDFVTDIRPSDANFTIADPYVNAVYLGKNGINLNAGARLNTHSEYGNHLVYNFNPSYTLPFADNYLKILTSYSTAFITPSLFQLFAADFGNDQLDPERDRTIESGLEFNLHKKHTLSVLYFNRSEKDFIDFVLVNPDTFESQYQNIPGSFTAEGLELTLESEPIKNLKLSGNYTHTDRKKALRIRIPLNKVNLSANYALSEKTNFSLTYQYTDSRDDVFFSAETFTSENVKLKAYDLLNFYFSHQLDKHFRLFGSVTNIFNEDYEEVFGFTTKGNNVRLGVDLRF